jgi:hypothetical protein
VTVVGRKRSTRDASSPALATLDTEGWIAVPDVLSPDEAHALADACAAALDEIDNDKRIGDKQAGGTRRLVDLVDRVPSVSLAVEHPGVVAAVGWFLGESARLGSVTFRSPRPGFGEQRLHIDHLPLERPGEWRVATAIVALCDFRSDNGATAVVPGSHRRPDLQRHPDRLTGSDAEVVLTASAGTAFVFSGHLLHRGTRNRSRQHRPALQAVWNVG